MGCITVKRGGIAEARAGRRTKFITENYFVFGESAAVISGGVRFWGERLSADAGIAAFVGDDIMNGIVKSVVFGTVISWIAVYQGYHAAPPTGGGSGATKATDDPNACASITRMLGQAMLSSVGRSGPRSQPAAGTTSPKPTVVKNAIMSGTCSVVSNAIGCQLRA